MEGKVEQVENLRRELLYPPVREKRYFLSDKDDKIWVEYNKNLINLKCELSEYSRCKSVIYMLEKYPDASEEKYHLDETKKQYNTAIIKLGAYNSVWLVFMHEIEA